MQIKIILLFPCLAGRTSKEIIRLSNDLRDPAVKVGVNKMKGKSVLDAKEDLKENCCFLISNSPTRGKLEHKIFRLLLSGFRSSLFVYTHCVYT